MSYKLYILDRFDCCFKNTLQRILSMSQLIKFIQIKTPDIFLAKRKESLHEFGALGPADTCMLQFCKEGTFLSKKEERTHLWFFQGLNVYPQNLSLLLKDWAYRESKTSKDKLIKGIFAIYDVFEKFDAIVQINIPGSLKIFKTGDNKQILSNDSIDSMYVSSILRTIYERNIEWGRYYELFTNDKPIDQFKAFMQVFAKLVAQKDLYINDQYDQKAVICGSHCCSLVYQMIQRKRIVHHAIDFYTQYMKNNTELFWKCPKLVLLYAQLLTLDLKFYKSLRVTTILAEKYNYDPLLLFYQAKYLHKLSMDREAIKIIQNIKQYNQLEIWLLMADIQIALNRFSEALLCLNYAGKLVKNIPKSKFNYKQFENIGRIRRIDPLQDLECFPMLHQEVQQPIIFQEKHRILQSLKILPHSAYWKLQPNQRKIFDRIMTIRQNIDKPKFQQVIQNTFQTTVKDYPHISFKIGFSHINVKTHNNELEDSASESEQDQGNVHIPQFLVDKQEKPSVPIQPQRNLSIIPEIQSFIENSVFEQKKKSELSQQNRHKNILHERMMRLIKAVFHQNQIEFDELIKKYNTVLPYYNKLRKSIFSNYIYKHMMSIFSETQNYRSMIVLIAQILNDLEAYGVKKLDRLPFWIQPYLFEIISEKGLSYVNQHLQKLKFYDEAVIDCIKKATAWKLKGSDY